MRRSNTGFTLVELAIVIAVIAILATLTIVIYSGIRHRADDSRVLLTTAQSTDVLEVYYVKQRDYPPNFAGTGYAAPETVTLTLYTNAPQQRIHANLSPDQNAQLLLNTCNANMPVEQGGTTYNTGCMFSGNNFHVKGQSGSNVVLNGPEVTEAEFQLSCGASCNQVRQAIVAEFTGQGGVFPIQVPKGKVAIPTPSTQSYGKATNFCLEARSVVYDDIIYHTTHASTDAVSGRCPEDASLHYP